MSTLSVAATERVRELASMLNAAGVPPDFSPPESALLLAVWGEVAKGEPLAKDRVEQLIATTGGEGNALRDFLSRVTERDAQGRIVGAVGLSQNHHPHAFTVDAVRLATWCAWDALFVPAGLGRPATVESRSPVTGEPIRIEVTPDGVRSVAPESAAVTIAVLDKPVDSVEEAWMVFCHQVLFFSSVEEAESWAEGRGSIEVLTVPEAFELGREAFKSVFEHASLTQPDV